MHHQIFGTSKKMWVLILGSGLNTLGIFISIPLINIYAVEYFKLSPVQIGFIYGIWPATVFCLSLFCGMIAERRGYLNTLRFGIILNCIAFLLMSLSTNVFQFCMSIFLMGIGKAFIINSIRTTMISLAEGDEIEKCFRLRYLLQNVACVIGPLIGIAAYGAMFGKIFILSMSTFLIFLFISFIGLRRSDFKNIHHNEKPTMIKNFSVLKNLDLQYWIISGTCILMAYGAYEGFMPIVTSGTYGNRPNYGFLVSLNAFVVIILQLGHLKLGKNVDIKKSISYGFIFLALGFFLFASSWHTFEMTLIATIIISIGESILFPCFDVVMGRIAPYEQKAIYYGAGELKQIGFFLGPTIGGLLLEYGGTVFLFIGCALSIVVANIFFNKISKE